MSKRPTIGVIVGSLQATGLSSKVATAVERLGQDLLDFRRVAIGDLPLYNPELEADGGSVEAWTTFRDSMRPLDGVLFVTPEYNRSVPGALKNAIDVGSRPYGASIFSGKPAGVISQSPGAVGGFGANHHLRQSLVFLDMPTMQQPEAYLGHSAALFDEAGDLIDGSGRTFLNGFVTAFAAWVARYDATT
jgi:chromate reductase